MNEEVGSRETGNFLTRFVWTLTSPKRLYADIADGEAKWWEPWVWVSLISMVVAHISMPIQVQLARLNPRNLPEEELQQGLEMMEKFGIVGVISTPVVVLLTSIIVVSISYLVLSVLADGARFKKFFTLYLYASIVSSLGLLLGTILTRMKGVEAIQSIEDATVSFGPDRFVDADQKILHAVLQNFGLFHIWFYVLVAAGVAYVFKLSKGSAAVVVVPVLLVAILVTLITARFSGQ
jgi:hypothetical protein